MRAAWVDVDLDAITHNVKHLRARCAPAQLCAVVKADGYGHGAVAVARASLQAGATMVAVALVEEGAALRGADIDSPILLLSQPAPREMADVVALGLTPTLDTPSGVVAAARAAEAADTVLRVHLKVDTGMHRVGVAVEDAADVAKRIVAQPNLRLEGLCTHFSVADDPDDPFTDTQLARFAAARDALASAGINPQVVHAANSAATLRRSDTHFDLVRCGIALYGLAPSAKVDGQGNLRPALTLRAEVSHVKRVGQGEALSYGRRYHLDRDTVVATVPVGYADGVSRTLGASGGVVLIGGERLPIAGTVTMDQILVDCGPSSHVAVGDEVVLLGTQGDASVSADEWAQRLGTINYEVVCGFGARLPRRYPTEQSGT